ARPPRARSGQRSPGPLRRPHPHHPPPHPGPRRTPARGAHRDLTAYRSPMDAATLKAHVDAIARDGYTVVEDAIEPDLVDALNDDLERLERELHVEPAGNSFEGSRTLRVYNLLAHGELWQRV